MHTLTPPDARRRVDRSQRTRQLALYLISLIVVAGTVTAFIQSYEGLCSWAGRYLSDGWARTWPLQVDAWIAVGELALYVAYRDRWPARRRIWPWLAALTGLVASTGFNVGHLADADLAGQLTAAVPPVAAFGGLFLGLQVLKYVEDDTSDRRGQHAGVVPLLAALQLARHLVTADRLTGHRNPPVNVHTVNARRSDRRPGRINPAIQAKALQVLTAEPGITGAALAHQLGVSERTGRRLIKRIRRVDPPSV